MPYPTLSQEAKRKKKECYCKILKQNISIFQSCSGFGCCGCLKRVVVDGEPKKTMTKIYKKNAHNRERTSDNRVKIELKY